MFSNTFYQYYFNSSLLAQISAQKKVSIVQDNLITLNPPRQTETYDQTNRLCFLFNGSTTIGQIFNDKVSLYPRYFYNKIFFDSTDSRLV